MLVDDEEDISLLFKAGLEKHGYFKVDVYNNAKDATDHFKPDLYDLILIDIIMPGMNGLEFYTGIRDKIRYSKICFFSAAMYDDSKIKDTFPELKEQKMVLIQKPIKLKDLANKVMEIISKSNY